MRSCHGVLCIVPVRVRRVDSESKRKSEKFREFERTDSDDDTFFKFCCNWAGNLIRVYKLIIYVTN